MKTRTIVFSVLGVIVLMVFCFAFTIHILLLNVRNEYRKLNLGDKREEKGIEYLNLVQKMIEDDFNVIINKDLYEVEYVFIPNGNIITADSFIMKKRKLTYKSKYFYPIFEKSEKVMIVDHMDDGYLLNKEKESYYKDERLSLFLAIISRFGFEEYVLNNLLYDESKGNNFSEIEKIFDKYKKGKIYRNSDYSYGGGFNFLDELEYNDKTGRKWQNNKNGFIFYNQPVMIRNKEDNDKFLKNYGDRLRDYFNKKRKFEEINWYEFMKYNHLKPRVTFIFENATEDDLKKLEKLIKPYYNEKEISIILESNS